MIWGLEGLKPEQKLALLQEKDNTSQTVLHLAAKNGRSDYIKVIWGLEDLTLNQKLALLQEKDKNGRTALDLATLEKQTNIATMLSNLLKNAADEGAISSAFKPKFF